MASTLYEFINNSSLPSNDDIIDHCVGLGLPRGTTIVDPSTKSIIAWIKCGPNVTVNEARTQHWTAMTLREAGISQIQAAPVFRAFTADYFGTNIGYIVMQYFEGQDCDSNDVDLIAKAVEALISLRAPPTATLGHIDGGTSSIVNSFFPEWLPNANYRSDQDFFDHIHNIFDFQGIDFQGDISTHGRFLCPSDFNPGNFRKHTTPDGQSVVVVLDFRATCFMPLPFIEVSLKINRDTFRQSLIGKIEYPHGRSDDAQVLLSASGPLVQYGERPVALPPGVSSTIGPR